MSQHRHKHTADSSHGNQDNVLYLDNVMVTYVVEMHACIGLCVFGGAVWLCS